MANRISRNWMADLDKEIRCFQQEHGPHIDRVISWNTASKWLIVRLAKSGLPYKVYQLGGGVKRITTDTDACPCCKRMLDQRK